MESDFTYYEQIDQYLTKNMSSNELADFEREMASNPSLQEEVTVQKELRDVVIGASLSDVRSMMENDLQQTPKQGINKKWLGFLGVILCTSIGVFLYNSNPTKNDKVSVSKSQHNEIAKPIHTNTPIPKKESEIAVAKPIKHAYPTEVTSSPARVDSVINPIIEKSEVKVESDAPAIQPTIALSAKKEETTTQPQIAPFAFNGKVKTVEAEYQKGNGEIHITGTVKGGKTPYQYAIYEDEYQNEKSFSNIAPGNYTVQVTDANNSTLVLDEVIIKESNCLSDYNQSFIPTYDNYWEIPVPQNSVFTFKVFNLKGLVYENNFELGEQTQWFGTSTQEEKLGIGYYRFEIKFENGEQCNGELTIGN